MVCGEINYKTWAGDHGNMCFKCHRKAQEIAERKRNVVPCLKRAGIGKRYIGCSLDNYQGGEKYVKFCREWIKEGNREESIFFTGSFGSGKTHLSVALCRELFLCHELYEVYFESSIDLLYEIRKSFSSTTDTDEIIKRYSQVDYLVIDDLGAEKTTEWSIETLSLIIDRRDRNLLPTIVTSNLSLNEVAEKISGRIASRMANGKIVKIDMPDYRKKRNNRG